MRRGRARAAIAALSAAVFVASQVNAAETIEVTIEGCSLDEPELARLVRLELGSVLESSEVGTPHVVTIQCEGNEAKVTLFDPVTKKAFERRVSAPKPGAEEAERLLALTVAQLYRGTRLGTETPVEDAPQTPKKAPDADSSAEAKPSAREKASAIAAPKPVEPPPEPRGSLGIVAGAHVRRIQSPIVMPSLEVMGTWSPFGSSLWLSLTGGAEYASVDRRSGIVDIAVGKALAGIGIEPVSDGTWSAFVDMALGVAVNHIRASEVASGYYAGETTGAAFEGSIGLGGALRVGPVRFELAFRGGAMLGGPVAQIADDDDVTLNGPWMGGDLRVRFLF
ncbi:MAG: hypothetical protein HOW73_03005 [Polyangiaceae bacterium]|nr:hypothetical protein [Polyangiaceae bacterium]